MSIALLWNGNPAPSSFQVGGSYQLTALLNGAAPLAVEWNYGRRGEPQFSGTGIINFEPDAIDTYYLHVICFNSNGFPFEQVFVIQVTASGQSPVKVTVAWDNPRPNPPQSVRATVLTNAALSPRSIEWTVYINNVPILSGGGPNIFINAVQPGILRVLATVIDAAGNTATADSSIAVPSPVGIQSAIIPQAPDGTLQLLGTVFSAVIEGGAIQSTYLPYELTSVTDTVRLLPGTTHFVIDLDPANSLVDDEVVVRTPLGNWTLIGPPGGLSTEALPYDYQHNHPIQPAPFDLNMRYTVDAWNVHDSVATPFKFRVRFKCYAAGPAIYQYSPCEWSSYTGGAGARQRRFLGLITQVDATLDAESPQNRLGSQNVETYSTPDRNLLLGTFAPQPTADQPSILDDHLFSQQTALTYESPGGILQDIQGNAVYGIAEGIRPAVLDFTLPAKPRIVNRLSRLHGKFVLYVAGGAISKNTVITVTFYTNTGTGTVTAQVTAPLDVYNPDTDRFLKVGEVGIDISDFEFDRLGIRMDFSVNESSAGTNLAPPYDPLASVPDPYFYSSLNSPALSVDTACFRNPVQLDVFEGTFVSGTGTLLNDCNKIECGPIGIYCYTAIAGTGTLTCRQPLGFPAPFVASTVNQTTCYGSPVFMGEGTTDFGTVLAGTVVATEPVIGYTGTTACGVAFEYAPCTFGSAVDLAVIYPLNTSPHAAIQYGNQCYGLSGTLTDLTGLEIVSLGSVNVVTSCADTICTGSNPAGGSMDYSDPESQALVTVSFPHLDSGVPYFAVAPENATSSYGNTQPGAQRYTVSAFQTVFPLFTATEAADVTFKVSPPGVWREIVATRNGQRLHFRLYPGLEQGTLSLQPGDIITLEFGRYANQLLNVGGEVSWVKNVAKSFQYDTASLSFTGTRSLKALGFCGLTNRDDYVFYGTLPAITEMTLPNPDSVVTVQAGTLPELVVVRTKAVNEPDYFFNMASYQGQGLVSPATFRFYAARNPEGVHGEMDVWLSADAPNRADSGNQFPLYFRVSDYKALVQTNSPVRKTTQPTDTSRRGLRVTDATTAADFTSPRVFVDDRGARVSAWTSQMNDNVFLGGITDTNPYVFNGMLDKGISDSVHKGLRGGGGPSLVLSLSTSNGPREVTYDSVHDRAFFTTQAGVIWGINSNGVPFNLFSLFSSGTNVDSGWGITHCPSTDELYATLLNTAQVNVYDKNQNLIGQIPLPPSSGGGTLQNEIRTCYDPTLDRVVIYASWFVGIGDFRNPIYLINPHDHTITTDFETPGFTVFRIFPCATTKNLMIGPLYERDYKTGAYTALTFPFLVSAAYGCDAPDVGLIFYGNQSNPAHMTAYDPKSHTVVRYLLLSPGQGNPLRAVAWHKARRKLYWGEIFDSTFGQGALQISDVNAHVWNQFAQADYAYDAVYMPRTRNILMTVPIFNGGGNKYFYWT